MCFKVLGSCGLEQENGNSARDKFHVFAEIGRNV